MKAKEIIKELLSEENESKTLKEVSSQLISLSGKIKFTNRLLMKMRDLEMVCRNVSEIRSNEDVAKCLAAIDDLFNF